MNRDITLRVYEVAKARPIYERLSVEETTPGRYRLVHSPGLVEGLAAGDEIELADNAMGYNVIQRGGNINVWLFIRDARTADVSQLRTTIESLGGYLDGGTEQSLIFTVPGKAGFKKIEDEFDEFVRHHDGSSWMFANVYDPIDGKTPLKWW